MALAVVETKRSSLQDNLTETWQLFETTIERFKTVQTQTPADERHKHRILFGLKTAQQEIISRFPGVILFPSPKTPESPVPQPLTISLSQEPIVIPPP